MTVNEAFAKFKSNLELPDKKQDQAASAQKEMREEIALQLLIYDSFLAGSYSRYTKIDPLNDIDVFLVRNNVRTGLSTDGSGVTPSQALEDVRRAVKSVYTEATTKLQSHSVNVQVPGIEFGFDLVPAWLRNPDGYWIPDTDTGGWMATDPLAHNKLLTDANQAVNGVLKPTIKMMKHWSRNNLNLFRSFHIELICKAVLVADTATDWFDFNVRRVLHGMTAYVDRQMMDPIYGLSRVDKELSQSEVRDLTLRVEGDANRADQAWQLEEKGDHDGALKLWSEIFLSGFSS